MSAPAAKPKRAPTLYAIIGFKLLKGLAFLVVGCTAYIFSKNDLPQDFQQILHWLKQNPERKFWHDLGLKVDEITEKKMMLAAAGTLVYSLFSLVEGVGLMFRVSWAGWMSIGESAFFIPIEIYELSHNPSWLVFGIMVANVIIVWYLFQNRNRLFKHH